MRFMVIHDQLFRDERWLVVDHSGQEGSRGTVAAQCPTGGEADRVARALNALLKSPVRLGGASAGTPYS